eukprot:Awhi_evm2s4335
MSFVNGTWRARKSSYVYKGEGISGTPSKPSVYRKQFHTHHNCCRLCKEARSAVQIIITESLEESLKEETMNFQRSPNSSNTSLNSSDFSLDFLDLSDTEIDIDDF